MPKIEDANKDEESDKKNKKYILKALKSQQKDK